LAKFLGVGNVTTGRFERFKTWLVARLKLATEATETEKKRRLHSKKFQWVSLAGGLIDLIESHAVTGLLAHAKPHSRRRAGGQ
jgi:hypothetical protein